jgi:hypothetical protein
MTLQEILEAVKELDSDDWEKLERQIAQERHQRIVQSFKELSKSLPTSQIEGIRLAFEGQIDYSKLNLPDFLTIIDTANHPDQKFLREYLDNLYQTIVQIKLAMFDKAIDDLHANLTPEEIAQITYGMNVEYIEPFDEDEWRDNNLGEQS